MLEHAFVLAEGRRGHVVSATKSNASRYGYVLWDEVAAETAERHSESYASGFSSTLSPRG